MPNEYAPASSSPRRREGRDSVPTINEDKIGNMGNTQGVNDSSTPKPKNTATTRHTLPLCNTSSISAVSPFEEAVIAGFGSGALVVRSS